MKKLLSTLLAVVLGLSVLCLPGVASAEESASDAVTLEFTYDASEESEESSSVKLYYD